MAIDDDASGVLQSLADYEESPNDPRRGRHALDGDELVRITGLDQDRLNDAVSLLSDSGYVDARRYVGTLPYDFGNVELTPQGRREAERFRSSSDSQSDSTSTRPRPPTPTGAAPTPDLRYVTSDRIGEGAYGEVWRAYDTLLKRPIAIKFIRQSGSSNDALAHARALVRVPHPNIVTIFDVTHVLDPSTGTVATAIVMELVEGLSLDKRLLNAVSPDEARRIGTALLDAVAAYHAHNLAHMDLHGGNIIVGSDVVKVLDASCTDSGYVGSSATREGQHRRDLGWVRDHLRSMLTQGAASMDATLRFERETIQWTLDGIRRAFAEAVPQPIAQTTKTVDVELLAAVIGECNEQGDGCMAKDEMGAVYQMDMGPNRAHVNVCRPCLDQLVADGRWRLLTR